MQQKYWVIIPAAGTGTRMQGDIPKQYFKIAEKTILAWTLDIFLRCDYIERIIVGIANADVYWPILNVSQHEKVTMAMGGNSRAQTVLNCLNALSDCAAENDWILVHDAARPCLRQSDLEHLIKGVGNHPTGGILATPVADTIKRCTAEKNIIETIDRRLLWQAQTPQLFRYELLKKQLAATLEQNIEITDEAMAFELAGLQALIVQGSADNIKITTPNDLSLARYILEDK